VSNTSSSIAIGISTLALIISAANFYFSQLQVRHSLRVVIVADSGQRTKFTLYGTAPFFANILLLNDGNRTESIVGAQFSLTTDGEVLSSPPVGPFVIKSNDSVVARSSSPVSPNNTGTMKPNVKSSLSLEITFVDLNGILAERSIDLGTIALGHSGGDTTLEFNLKPVRLNC
jgi:hypothetical protein